MPESSLTDWLMVCITFVYMLFTIGIFKANLRSSKSAKSQLEETKKQLDASKTQFEKQLAETKRQYEERKRLSIMPYFQCDYLSAFSYEFEKTVLIKQDCFQGSTHQRTIIIKNIGLGTAKDIKYQVVNLSGAQEVKPFIFQSAISGENHTISLTFPIPFDQTTDFSIFFDLSFCDLLDNQYSQRIEFLFIRNVKQANFSMESVTYGIIVNSQEQSNA